MCIRDSYTSNDVSILLGNSDGTFQTAVNYPVGVNPDYLAVGDFNGDKKLDLAVVNYSSTTCLLYTSRCV